MSHESEHDCDTVRLPVDEFVRQIAREAARTVIDEHAQHCQIADVARRVCRLEIRAALLIGVMAGSGLLGGLAGSLISTCF